MRRSLPSVIAALAAFGLVLGAAEAPAQSYPNRPIQLIIPGNAGLMQDLSGRLFSEEVGRILGAPMTIMNKPGGSYTLGTDFVVRSKKDGYTLLYTATAPLVYPRILNPKSISYNADKDLEPLGGRALFPFTVAVREDSPWKTFADFIDHAKKHPGEIRVATPGIETVSNFDLEIIQAQTGAKFTHVPITKGPAIQLLGGHIEGVILPITEVNSYTSGGKFRILAASHRLAEFPKVPTILELGYRQDIIATWFGFFAPAGIPEEVRKVLVAAVEKAVKNPQVKARVEKLSFIVDYKNPAEMRKMVTEEYEIVNDIAGKIGLRK